MPATTRRVVLAEGWRSKAFGGGSRGQPAGRQGSVAPLCGLRSAVLVRTARLLTLSAAADAGWRRSNGLRRGLDGTQALEAGGFGCGRL